MSNITVKFLNKEYSIPEDVLTYIDLLDFTNDVQNKLMSAFLRLSNKSEMGGIDDKDMTADIQKQVNRFIAKLCDYGIYDRTCNDYLQNNKGYEAFSSVNKDYLNKMKELLMRKLNDFQAGFEDAMYKKEASVTGMGFSIWSGSFVNHAIYAAMQASTIHDQEKAAAKEYQKDMDALSSRINSDFDRDSIDYIKNVYIPNMEIALTALAYELLDRYISDLIKNGKFNAKTMNYVDITRSNDLLENLNISSNKEAVFENAFVACPYNIAVYMQAMKCDMLDYESFQTAKIFKQDTTILSFLKESWGEVSFPTKFNINYHCINTLCLYTKMSATELLRSYTELYTTGIVKAYSRVIDMLGNKELCNKVIREFDDNSILAGDTISKKKAHAYIDSIVTATIWNQLVDKCGHGDLVDRIKSLLSDNADVHTKNDIDEYLLEHLISNFEEARENLVINIKAKKEAEEKRRIEQEKQKAEQERIRKEKRAAMKATFKKGLKISAFITAGIVAVVIVVSLIFLFVNNVIMPANRYNDAVELMENEEWLKAKDILLSLDDYKDSEDLLEQCNNEILADKYENAQRLINNGKYSEALQILEEITDYKDSEVLIKQCKDALQEEDYNNAIQLMENGEYEKAILEFTKLSEYKDSADLLNKCQNEYNQILYDSAINMIAKKDYAKAYSILSNLGDYKDAGIILNNHFKIIPLKETYTSKDGKKTIHERTIEPYGTNSQGTLIKETQTYEDGDTFVTEEIYDAYGNLIVYLNKFSSGKETGTTYTYDSNHKLLIQRNSVDYYGKVATTNYEYDSNNRLIRTVLVEEDGSEEITTFTYDAKGNLIKEYSRLTNERYSEDFPYETIIEYTYDSNGRVLTDTWTFDDGDQSVRKYYYDAKGFLKKEVSEKYGERLEYHYDNNHYLIGKNKYSDSEQKACWEYSEHSVFYSENGFRD